ncbi:MAG: hypothetical protein ABIP78_03870 [Pyrinomonadaceae bacterium]
MKAMKVLQKILFTFGMVVVLTFAVSAQKNDQKKPPPKGDPPVVTPQPKPPPPRENPPPDSNKPKKPGFSIISRVRPEGESA